jgi:hypothetical protein
VLVVDRHFEWVDFVIFCLMLFLCVAIFLFPKFFDIDSLDFLINFSFGFLLLILWRLKFFRLKILPKTWKYFIIGWIFFQKLTELLFLSILLIFLLQILFVRFDRPIIAKNVCHKYFEWKRCIQRIRKLKFSYIECKYWFDLLSTNKWMNFYCKWIYIHLKEIRNSNW